MQNTLNLTSKKKEELEYSPTVEKIQTCIITSEIDFMVSNLVPAIKHAGDEFWNRNGLKYWVTFINAQLIIQLILLNF